MKPNLFAYVLNKATYALRTRRSLWLWIGTVPALDERPFRLP